MTTHLYIVWGVEREALYVGHTKSLTRRLKEHARSTWWPNAVEVASWEYPDKDEALAHERYAIRYLTPVHNILSNPAAPWVNAT